MQQHETCQDDGGEKPMEQLLAISLFAPLSGLAFRRLKTAFLKIEMFESLCYIFEK